ncbi:MAG: hypothetical protein NZ809_04380 [Thermodesulfovibrio sp.]|nr:hypothetical protein [Thermodesulfovibrio sp.]
MPQMKLIYKQREDGKVVKTYEMDKYKRKAGKIKKHHRYSKGEIIYCL